MRTDIGAVVLGLGLGLVLGCGSGTPSGKPAAPVRYDLRMAQDEDGTEIFELTGLDPGRLSEIEAGLEAGRDIASNYLVVCMRHDSPVGHSSKEDGSTRFEPPTAILGAYSVKDGSLRFKPRFPISRGAVVDVYADPMGQVARALEANARGERGPLLVRSYVLPKGPDAATTRVLAVYPSSDVLPENLLKFYVHFSAPMSRGMAYDCVKLYDAEGREVDMPFLELPEELWDPSSQRLTLLLDPGRIKSELLPRRELGPALQAGQRYSLVVLPTWLDAEGRPLETRFVKAFRVGPADTTMPNPADWKLNPPSAATRDPLTILFPEPMDHGLLERVIGVVREGETLPGRVRITDEERCWQFTPDEPWTSGEYRVTVQTILEDLAGNNLKRPFEVDLLHPLDRAVAPEVVSLPFRIP